jgi:Ala-tRNA(Pro) deacylase
MVRMIISKSKLLMEDLLHFLEKNGIDYQRCDHPAVFTAEEAGRVVPPLPGAKTKNLFLRDRRGRRHFLVVVPGEQTVNMKGLIPQLGVTNLSFASPERLKKYLGITPGSVSMLALFNDSDHQVEFYIDGTLWQAEAFLCHPLVNTATLVVSKKGIKAFLEATGHEVNLLTNSAEE